MRTIIYVDGFNLYFGRMKDTTYKWLNLSTLFERILQNHHEINRIKYFTANLKKSVSDPTIQDRQKAYIGALKTLPNIEVHLGKFSVQENWMRRARPPHHRILVEKKEEKGSDVNLAVNLLNDAWKDEYDCAVVVTDDTDMLGALKTVKREFPTKKIGLVSPRGKFHDLGRYADFKLKIDDSDLRFAQFDDPVRRQGKVPIYKPASW